MSSTVGLKLDDETRARLGALAKVKDRSSHWLMKRAVMDYLDREERYESEKQEDLARWREYEQTGVYVSDDDMNQWFDELVLQARQPS